MAYTSIVLSYTRVSCLLVRRDRNTIAITLQDEDYRETLTSGPIDRLENIAFRGRGFPM